MVDNSREVRKQIFNVLGCLAAAVTILTYLVLCINAQWPFLEEGTFVYKVLVIIETYAPFVVVGLVGIEYVADKHFLFRVLFYAMIALVVLSWFFPATWSKVVGIAEETAEKAKEVWENNV